MTNETDNLDKVEVKIIVAYAQAGAGHFKAAEAIYTYFKEHYNRVDVKLVDILRESTPFFRLSYALGYNFLIRYAIFLWRVAFRLTYCKTFRVVTKSVASLINYLNTKKFVRLLILENPDFIVSTHFLPSEVASTLKINKKIKSKVINVITDFGVHPFWISKGTDIYIVATSFTKDMLIEEGVQASKIKEFGIPIDVRFTDFYDKYSLGRKLAIDTNKFTLLIVTGSFGIGPIEEIVDGLEKDIQILVVCARNKRLYKRLVKKNYPNTRIFRFIDNMHELMAVSDVIVTKPGGLSIAELLSMELVPIFICAIPGQETANAKILSSLGIGFSAKNSQEIKTKILDYKEHPDKLESVKQKIRQIKKPFATGEFCDAICQGSI